jgi:hypothetical protein
MAEDETTPIPEPSEVAKILESEHGVYFTPLDEVPPAEAPPMDGLSPVDSPATPPEGSVVDDAPAAPEP